MALSLNHSILAGNLTTDPELRTVGSTSVCKFRLAVNRRFKSASGEDKEETLFIDVEHWGKGGEADAKYLRKASAVVVEGRLKLDEWTDKDGGKRSKISVNAHSVQFNSPPKVDGAAEDSKEPWE